MVVCTFRVITLADWYHTTSFDATSKFSWRHSWKNRNHQFYDIFTSLDAWFAGGPEPVPDSGLINGLGRYQNGPEVELARINVKYGKRYRFRLISLSAGGEVESLWTHGYIAWWKFPGIFEFSISNHSMTVIEADGDLLLPLIATARNIIDYTLRHFTPPLYCGFDTCLSRTEV